MYVKTGEPLGNYSSAEQDFSDLDEDEDEDDFLS